MSTAAQFNGVEYANGPDGFKDVIYAQDEGDLGIMLIAAAATPGFSAKPIHAEREAIDARGLNAREMAEWEVRVADQYGKTPSLEQIAARELDARQEAQARLAAGEIAVRIAARRVNGNYPNTGAFYTRLFGLRDQGHAY